MKDIKFIATDMDNTLLTSKGELPPDFFSLVAKLKEQGVEFAAASGRPLYTLLETFAELKNEMTFICDNGGLIMHHGDVIFTSELPREDYRKMATFAAESDGIPIVCGMDAAYINQADKAYDAIYRTFYTKINYVASLESLDITADKFTLFFPNKDSLENYENVFAPAFGEQYSVVVSGPEWIDIMNEGIDKGTAMTIIGEKLHISLADMMAFGDTHNDAGMLKAVGHSYIVANGNPEIAHYAKFTAPTNDEYGVMRVMEKLLKVKQQDN